MFTQAIWKAVFAAATVAACQQIDHAKYRVRAICDAFLSDHDAVCEPCIRSYLDRNDLSPEAEGRLAHICNRLHVGRADWMASHVVPDDYPCLPWIDMLPKNAVDYDAQSYYLEKARLAPSDDPARWAYPDLPGGNYSDVDYSGSYGAGVWEDYRRATYLWVRDQISEGRFPADLKKALNEARDNEIEWIRTTGKQYRSIYVPDRRRR